MYCGMFPIHILSKTWPQDIYSLLPCFHYILKNDAILVDCCCFRVSKKLSLFSLQMCIIMDKITIGFQHIEQARQFHFGTFQAKLHQPLMFNLFSLETMKIQCHESRKRHLRRPHFSIRLTKLAILSDYKCPGLICLALPARQKFGLLLVIKFFFNFKLSKKNLNKKCAPNLLFFNEKKIRDSDDF